MFLHLISLHTINHIYLSFIRNFPLSSLTLSVNLLRLDMSYLTFLDYTEEDNYFKTVQSEMLPKTREFHTSHSYQPTKKLLDVKGQDGRPVFNFMDLRQRSMSFVRKKEPIIRYLLHNAKLLERLHLYVEIGQSLVGLLSTCTPTLKVLDLSASLYRSSYGVHPLAGLCEESKAMAGYNTLEVLSFEVHVNSHYTEDSLEFASFEQHSDAFFLIHPH